MLRWLRFVLNPMLPMPEIHDWRELYGFASKQTLLGVCNPVKYVGIQLNPTVLLEWMGKVELLREANVHQNKQVVTLTKKLKDAGFRSCILKGQGNTVLYPDAMWRTPGDIDVWVDAEKDSLYEYIRSQFPEAKDSFKHIKFPLFEDTQVDVHSTPLKLYNTNCNNRLQRWIEEQREQQMTHYVRLAGIDSDIAIPTAEFNAVYQLGHILIHVEDRGVGLRQFVDYFFVLKALTNIRPEQKTDIIRSWKALGLMRFARAVMWVEHVVLGLPKEYLIVEPDERGGCLLSRDVLEGGNFGHYSERMRMLRYGRYAKKFSDAWHMVSLSTLFPTEAGSRLVNKLKTAVKMQIKK